MVSAASSRQTGVMAIPVPITVAAIRPPVRTAEREPVSGLATRVASISDCGVIVSGASGGRSGLWALRAPKPGLIASELRTSAFIELFD